MQLYPYRLIVLLCSLFSRIQRGTGIAVPSELRVCAAFFSLAIGKTLLIIVYIEIGLSFVMCLGTFQFTHWLKIRT